jgi:hypothetical protein
MSMSSGLIHDSPNQEVLEAGKERQRIKEKGNEIIQGSS